MNIIEITNAYESAEEALADWSILDEPEVESVARAVSRQMARDYPHALEVEDAYQEAVVFLASRPAVARRALSDGPGMLNRWLVQRMRDKFLTDQKRRSEHKSWEVNQDQLEAQGY
ncbi:MULTISPECIES: hypothetical protein [unclassified Streptomyces]|uniref:hypothetical protein n=1 Tax=unclassified Streptomyces TaxID=2593676 RepID=UPI001B37555E|nr:hypothetical protein [Streptomyces sp. RK76]MBQ0949275.1 hypothetical protein [Streptomyces sp. RK76]